MAGSGFAVLAAALFAVFLCALPAPGAATILDGRRSLNHVPTGGRGLILTARAEERRFGKGSGADSPNGASKALSSARDAGKSASKALGGVVSTCCGAVGKACGSAAGALSVAGGAVLSVAGPVPGFVVGAAVNSTGALVGAASAGGSILRDAAVTAGSTITKGAGPLADLVVGSVANGTVAVLGAGAGVLGSAGKVLGDVAAGINLGGVADAASKTVTDAFKKLETECRAHPQEAAAVGAALLALEVSVLLRNAMAAKPVPEDPSALKAFVEGVQAATERAIEATSDAAAVMAAGASNATAALGSAAGAVTEVATEALSNASALSASVAGSGLDALAGALHVLADAVAPVTTTVADAVAEALDAVTDAARGAVEAVAGTIKVAPVAHTVVAGRLESGFVTVELARAARVGGVLVGNRAAAAGKAAVPTGTDKFELQVSADGRRWTTVYNGFLFPGPPHKSSQYLTFASEWAKFVRFRTLSGYKGGAGLASLRVFAPVGASALMWLWKAPDVLHSFLDLHYPEAWGTVEVPEADNVTALLLRAPVAMSRALGFKTPDDLGLNSLEARVQAAAPAVSRLGTKVWYWGAEAYTLSSAAGVRAAKLTAAASVNATKAAGKYGKRFGKLALRGANTGLNRTAEASVALGKATAEASVALGNKISQGSAQAWGLVEGGAANVSSAIAQAWEKAELPSLPALFSKSSPAAAKDRSANPFAACLPLAIVAGAAGAVAYPEEFKKLQTAVADKVADLTGKEAEPKGKKGKGKNKK